MNRKGFLLVGVTAAGLVLGLTLVPKVPPIDTMSGARQELDSRPDRTAALAADSLRASQPARGERVANMDEAHVDRLIATGYIPPEHRELWLDPDAEKKIKERFEIIPRANLPDVETCDPVEFDGSYFCWNEYGHHPYLAYPIDDLRQMAETDAVAADALVLRLPHENLHERLHYALLAAKISGKSGPIMRFAYSFTPDKDSPDYENQLLDRYAIALTAEAMGFPYRFSREIENHIRSDLNLSRDELDIAMQGRRVTLLKEIGGGS